MESDSSSYNNKVVEKTKTQENGEVKSVIRALVANFGIAVVKTVTAIKTGSGSMLAESIHSFADCANQMLLLKGMKEAKGPETKEHPLGTGRVTYFYSLIVALLLLFMGGVFSVYEGIHRFTHPEPLSHVGAAVVVIIISMLLEGYALKGALNHIKAEMNGKSFFKWFKETRSSEMLIVVGEDISALMGLSIAFVFLSLAYVTGNSLYDACGTISIGVWLIVVACFLIKEIKSLIIGESASPDVENSMHSYIANRPEVKTLYHLVTSQVGKKVVVLVQAEMHKTGSEDGLIDATNRVEQGIKKQFPEVSQVFFEADRGKQVHEYEDPEEND